MTLATRAKVFEIEAEMAKLPQLDLTTKHYFSDGVYARELHIPAGTALTGRVHKFENLNILIQGEMSVMMEEGIKRIAAPYTIVSPPGTKRVAYAHTDCIWTTILPTTDTDLDKIEAHFTTNNEADYLAFRESLKIEGK
jgi:hypothetical protein